MLRATVVAAEIALACTLPALADSKFEVADGICISWLASGPFTECFYSYDRGHYNINATIDLDGIHARRACPYLADTIAAFTDIFSDQQWRLRLFTPYGEPVAYCHLH